ncbi:MAG: 4-(cytidine 5'-diphospho)-2-C-methyl-D-erythritol kinase [Halanaerobium sp.]|nr:4-(cytidine 5'-diphospho)-2-C-methyl-D-erythritol kinase [Halanaerobium sp.]
MGSIEIWAPAKINLSIDVKGQRDDGYHLVEMVMQTIDLADKITLTLQEGTGDGRRIMLHSDLPCLPDDRTNLAYQAAELFLNKLKEDEDVSLEAVPQIAIAIKKKIPLAAGLAGGSTDAAGVLRGLNRLFGRPFSDKSLQNFGAQLGADVPFCLSRGTALATGTGIELEELPVPPATRMVLVNPSFTISTKKVFTGLSWREIEVHPPTEKIVRFIKEGVFPPPEILHNVLEDTAMQLYPRLAKYKMVMEQLFQVVLMSGSGPTLLGFVTEDRPLEKVAEQAAEWLNREGLPAKVAVVCTIGKDFHPGC